MTLTFDKTIQQQFMVVSCASCSVPFGITEGLYRRVVTHAIGSVYCPACGKRSHWRESEHEREKRQLLSQIESANRRADTLRRRADREEQLRAQTANKLRATKGVVTRIKNRVGKGVCPCCNRHFANLQQHMENQHPQFVEPVDG